jgi:cold shock CspA family protein
VSCTNDTHYYGYVYVDTTNSDLFCGMTATQPTQAYMIEGRSVKVEVRKTSAAGTGNIRGRVCYAIVEQ